MPLWLIRVEETVEIDWDSGTTDPKSRKKIEQEFMRIFDSLRKPNCDVVEQDLIFELYSRRCKIKFRCLEAVDELIEAFTDKPIGVSEPKPTLDDYYIS